MQVVPKACFLSSMPGLHNSQKHYCCCRWATPCSCLATAWKQQAHQRQLPSALITWKLLLLLLQHHFQRPRGLLRRASGGKHTPPICRSPAAGTARGSTTSVQKCGAQGTRRMSKSKCGGRSDLCHRRALRGQANNPKRCPAARSVPAWPCWPGGTLVYDCHRSWQKRRLQPSKQQRKQRVGRRRQRTMS